MLATDPEGGPLTYSLLNSGGGIPAFVTLPTSNSIKIAPDCSSGNGTFTVGVVIKDAAGYSTPSNAVLNIAVSSLPPVFTLPQPVYNARVNNLLLHQPSITYLTGCPLHNTIVSVDKAGAYLASTNPSNPYISVLPDCGLPHNTLISITIQIDNEVTPI